MIVEYRQTYLNHGKNQICAQGFRGQELVYPTRKVSFLYKNIEAFRIWKIRYCKKSLNRFNFDIRPIILDLTFRLLSHRLDNPSVLMSLNQMNTHTHTLLYLQPALMRTNIHTLSALPFNGALHRACSAEKRCRTVSNWFLAQDWAMYKTAPREYRSSFGHIQYLQLLRLTLMAAS